jgi:hypothetical protein
VDYEELLHILQELDDGIKVSKNCLSARVAKILDSMLDRDKIIYDGKYYSKEFEKERT